MNSRTKLLLLASLAAAMLACAACGGSHDVETADTAALVAAPAAHLLAPEPVAPATARRAFTPVVAPAEGLELAEESITEKSEKQKYEIDIAFPQLKGRLSPHAAKFNRAVRAFVSREVREFRRANDDSQDRPSPRHKGWEKTYDTLAGRYEVIHLDGDFASLRFNLFAYGRGAARPAQFHRVLNFDLRQGRALRLDELFKPGSEHLRALAAHSITALKRRDEDEHRREVARVTAEGRPAGYAGLRTPDSDFESGAGPQAENYRAWNLAAEGVVVTFAACQVFGCAAGEQEVLVPFSALAEILHEAGPAARLNAPQPR